MNESVKGAVSASPDDHSYLGMQKQSTANEILANKC